MARGDNTKVPDLRLKDPAGMFKRAVERSKGGRPPIYSDPEVMKERIIEYFQERKENDEPLTVNGLVSYLGFKDRHSAITDFHGGSFEEWKQNKDAWMATTYPEQWERLMNLKRNMDL